MERDALKVLWQGDSFSGTVFRPGDYRLAEAALMPFHLRSVENEASAGLSKHDLPGR